MHICALLLIFGVAAVQRSDAAQCDPHVVARINDIWEVFGYPDNLFQLHAKTWTVYKTTNSPFYEGLKCLTYELVNDHQYSFNRDGREGLINVTQVDGRIYIEGNKTNYFLVLATEEVTATYACSESDVAEPCDELPDARIAISPVASRASINFAERIQARLGFVMDKTYTC